MTKNSRDLQTGALLSLFAALSIGGVLTDSWHSIIASLASIGAVVFLWTLPEEGKAGPLDKRMNQLEDDLKNLSAKVGNIAMKTGFKGV